ncbi:hypothetical protein V493_01395 [Pseudogymnoascus sp. VKM F-4281 (FW-2241)]|nr:hypothetical protein V493_01395 [Pseudogymnoascus sp. VKM F-4281 (FW-2241)]
MSSSSSNRNADQQATGRPGPNTAPNNYGPVIVDSATYKLAPIEESNEEDPGVLGAVEALEQTTVREIGNGYVVDTPRAVANLVASLVDLPTSPPSLYLDIEGVSLGRNGSVSILQLLVLPTNITYLIDIHILGSTAFTTATTTGQTLQSILEDASIPKVFFDIRNDSDALYSHFSISLAGIHDIQLMELATRTRPRSKKFLHGLARCITGDLSLDPYEEQRWTEQKNRGRRLFAPEMGGSYEVFNERPMGEDIALYCEDDGAVEGEVNLDIMSGNSQTKVDIHILFFNSTTDPRNSGDVALWFNNSDPFLVHLAGPNGSRCLNVKENYYPAANMQFRKPVIVASGISATKAQIVSIVSRTPIDNSRPFNSEEWVGNALRALAQERYIEREEYSKSVGEMIDTTKGSIGRT